MSRQWFIEPEVVRLELFDGDGWIEVKKRLTFGEEQRLAGAMLGKASQFDKAGSAEVGIDMERFGIERLAIWIVNWSLPQPPTRASIAALAPEVVEEIDRVLEAHIEAQETEKKARTGRLNPKES